MRLHVHQAGELCPLPVVALLFEQGRAVDGLGINQHWWVKPPDWFDFLKPWGTTSDNPSLAPKAIYSDRHPFCQGTNLSGHRCGQVPGIFDGHPLRHGLHRGGHFGGLG